MTFKEVLVYFMKKKCYIYVKCTIINNVIQYSFQLLDTIYIWSYHLFNTKQPRILSILLHIYYRRNITIIYFSYL